MRRIEVDDPESEPQLVEVLDAKGRPRGWRTVRPQIEVKINRRGDILRTEHSQGQISDAAYQRGRILEKIFERAQPTQGGQWRQGSRVDAVKAHEHAIAINILVWGAELRDIRNEMVEKLGLAPAAVLLGVLENRASYEQVARARAKSVGRLCSARYVTYIAYTFREALEAYAALKDTAVGRGVWKPKRGG